MVGGWVFILGVYSGCLLWVFALGLYSVCLNWRIDPPNSGIDVVWLLAWCLLWLFTVCF